MLLTGFLIGQFPFCAVVWLVVVETYRVFRTNWDAFGYLTKSGYVHSQLSVLNEGQLFFWEQKSQTYYVRNIDEDHFLYNIFRPDES